MVAVGGYGRRELCPGSDLDVVLVHWGVKDVKSVAERLWYPVWDAGVGLDHSVRTVKEAVAVASEDLKAALGLLDARLVAGDAELAADLTQETFLDAWRDLERLADGRAVAPWLYRIARNNLLPHWRRRQPVSLDDLAAADGAEPHPLRQADPTPTCDERALIAQVLSGLSTPLQEALLLHCQQGLTSEEVGQALAISGEAARKRIGRAKTQFRQDYRLAC